MKKYTNPEVDIVKYDSVSVITLSGVDDTSLTFGDDEGFEATDFGSLKS